MRLKGEFHILFWIVAIFLACFYLPVGTPRFDNAIKEAFELVKWYAREHVLLCLIPAFFIAGAISTFISQNSVMKYLGAKANKVLAYGVASVSGSILAVCSCTVLPLFSGIYKMGAGLGPATAFLYSGPAINVIAMILTMRVLGVEIGVARIVGATLFSVVIGLIMHFIFRHEEVKRIEAQMNNPEPDNVRPLLHTASFFGSMVAILIFANWAKADAGIWMTIYNIKWVLVSMFTVSLGIILNRWYKLTAWKLILIAIPIVISAIFYTEEPLIPFAIGFLGLATVLSFDKGENGEWFSSSWSFAKQILPLLLGGVLVSGFLLGRPGFEGVIPSHWISSTVGGNSLSANFIASVVGAFMYFATLTEIPILQGLIGSGMGQGPALALLLAGPALSLPSMLVINKVLGPKKTFVYVTLVVIMATICGVIFGSFY
ncbi:MAG: permease [Oligoflexia bacterium]|nr:permease [Oligoflexia bacterium]